MSFVGQLTEADTTNVEITHVSVFAATELAASYDARSILRGARSAHLD
jgi:hypothetical protein